MGMYESPVWNVVEILIVMFCIGAIITMIIYEVDMLEKSIRAKRRRKKNRG